MAIVVSLEDYRPAPRYDGIPWASVRIEEGTASVGPWTAIDTLALSPVDSDPANPSYRNFTTDAATALDMWYRLTFLDGGGAEGTPSYPVQNSSATRPIYASVEELAALLQVRASDRHAALLRVLQSAAQEIDSEIGTADKYGTELPYGAPPAIVTEVNIERAVEHWKQAESPFGIIGMGDVGPSYVARDSWDRHAHKLAVLKGEWGVA